MSAQDYLSAMKKIYVSILGYIDYEDRSMMDYSTLIKLFDKLKIGDNFHLFKSLLHLLLEISNNHNRKNNLIGKIEQIIKHFKDQIKLHFQNWEIFNIFVANRRIILFLIEEKIIKIDNYVFTRLINESDVYREYFFPEIRPFLTDKIIKKYEIQKLVKKYDKIPKKFFEKRKSGENDSEICEIIRSDSVGNFKSFITKNNISIDDSIESSIFETNSFLLYKGPRLIEYAAFFGSNRIFNYLIECNAKFYDSLWTYAIHGRNTEIIRFLDENIKPISYFHCFKESVKCHHLDMMNYFQSIFLEKNEENSILAISKYFKHYNFYFMQNDFIKKPIFAELVKCDYYLLVDFLLQHEDLDESEINI